MFKNFIVSTIVLCSIVANQSHAMFFPWDEWEKEDAEKQAEAQHREYDWQNLEQIDQLLQDPELSQVYKEYLALKRNLISCEPIVIQDNQMPQLTAIINRVATKFKVKTPKSIIVPSKDLTPEEDYNAHVSVLNVMTLNEGILRILTTNELESVISHEISHIKRRHAFKTPIIELISIAVMVDLVISLKTSSVFSFPMRVLIGTGLIVLKSLFTAKMSRRYEKEADIDALHAMGENISSVNAQEKIVKAWQNDPRKNILLLKAEHCCIKCLDMFGINLRTHPKHEERLRYLREYQYQ